MGLPTTEFDPELNEELRRQLELLLKKVQQRKADLEAAEQSVKNIPRSKIYNTTKFLDNIRSGIST